MEIRIDGLETLLSKLDKVAEDQALNKGIADACKLVESKAKVDCPKDTSKLAESIHYEVEDLQGVVGTNVEYAPYVEIGTGIFSSQGDGRDTPWVYWSEKLQRFVYTVGQHPQPYLRPALVNQTDAIKKLIFDAALQEVRKR